MAEPRLSNILIMILIVGLFSLAIANFIGKGAVDYGVTGYDNSSLELMVDNVEDINSMVNSTSESLGTASADKDLENDIFGSFFLKAWQSIKNIGGSIKIFTLMIFTGVNNLPFITGAVGNMLINVLVGSVVIIITIAIFFHIIKPSNRL